MIEIAAAASIAAQSFKILKTGFSVGRDLESMAGDLSRWMGALSDLDQAEREAKNPPIFKKLFGGQSVEQEAIEVFAAKRQAPGLATPRLLCSKTGTATPWELY